MQRKLLITLALLAIGCGEGALAGDAGTKPDDAIVSGDAVLPDMGAPNCNSEQLSALFELRIRPLVQKGAPTSCNSCHLSGVNLGMFVQPSACASMACMVEKGLVDLSDPTSSRVLQLISQGTPKSSLITNAVRQKEYQGFVDWINFSASCHAETCGNIADPCGGASAPPPSNTTPMLGGCSEAALVQQFSRKVMIWRGRCASCHSPSGKGKKKGLHWLSNNPDDAISAMYNLIGAGAINTAKPASSLLLLKPLAESEGGVEHGGSTKIKNKRERTYTDFLAWIRIYAGCYAR